MIRVLLGSAFPVVGLALVAAFTGPDLVTGLSGAPMIVAGDERLRLSTAGFEGDACASTLLFAEKQNARPSLRVVAMALQPDGRDLEIGIRDIQGASGAPTETVVFLFDDKGRLVSISRPVGAAAPAATAQTCPEAPKHTHAKV
jgi:hypothetical protein